MKKQRNTLISYIFFYGGFLLMFASIFVFLFYTIILKNYDVNYLHLIFYILMFIGINMSYFASRYNLYYYMTIHSSSYYRLIKLLRNYNENGFIQGVPNNKFEEYKSLGDLKNGILELEFNKGIYKGVFKNNVIIIDMRGWILKNRYIYELLHTMLRVHYINKNNLSTKYIYKDIKNSNIEKITLVIKKGKRKKTYVLSNKDIMKCSICLKYKNFKKSKFINSNNITIKDFYSLNI